MDRAMESWMRAVESRDARFDGWVTVGVTSTGIYCRPSCPTPVRPKRANMRFFPTPASAQTAGFRACKRCAPDATPGSPEWNRRDDLVARAIRGIDDGVVDREGVGGLAARLAVSPRHLNRLLRTEVGATPIALARARRARAARVLIETTDVPFADVAFASGFDSVRQFNDTIRDVFAATPSEIRGRRASSTTGDWVSVRLAFRPPLDVDQLLGWLRSHAVSGVEDVDGATYRRSLALPGGPAVAELEIRSDHVAARFRLTALTDLQQAIQRSRRLLDLDADPTVIGSVLDADRALAPLVDRRPGVRSPGGVDGAETVARAIVHQQVSVASATSMCARLVADYGSELDRPVGSVTHVFPDPDTLAAVDPDVLPMPRSRARSLVAAMAAVADGSVDVDPTADRAEADRALRAIPGVGPWTASIVSLRGLSNPDGFSPGDLALRRQAEHLGLPSDQASLTARAERWRPWRAYAMHHLWAAYASPNNQTPPRGDLH